MVDVAVLVGNLGFAAGGFLLARAGALCGLRPLAAAGRLSLVGGDSVAVADCLFATISLGVLLVYAGAVDDSLVTTAGLRAAVCDSVTLLCLQGAAALLGIRLLASVFGDDLVARRCAGG